MKLYISNVLHYPCITAADLLRLKCKVRATEVFMVLQSHIVGLSIIHAALKTGLFWLKQAKVKSAQPQWGSLLPCTVHDSYLSRGIRLVLPSLFCPAYLSFVSDGCLLVWKCHQYITEDILTSRMLFI